MNKYFPFLCNLKPFIELKKAYDFVTREDLWKVPSKYGLENKLIWAIKSLYSLHNRGDIKINGECTSWIDIIKDT